MNHMIEVAKMFNLKVGEEFKVDCCDYTFKVMGNGYWKCIERPVDGGQYTDNALLALLNGNAEIVKLPFKPKEGEIYWAWAYVNNGLRPCEYNFYRKTTYCFMAYMLGNCYRTEAECLADTAMKERIENMERCKW